MWSLEVVLYVIVIGQFPYAETTVYGMCTVITSTNDSVPYHLSNSCLKILAQLFMKPALHRITMCQLLERRYLGEMEEQVEPANKNILTSIVETMCSIGYTCE